MRRHLTYANVTSTLALCLVLGAGGAYAMDHVGSKEVRNNSLRSDDLKNGVAVRGTDVRGNALTGRDIRETKLAASGLVVAGGVDGAGCEPPSTGPVDCVEESIRLRRTSRILAIATGDQVGDGVAASALCQVRIDGSGGAFFSHPGEVTNNTDATAANGFARTRVSEPLEKGMHEVALTCERDGSNPVRIDSPTLALIAVGSR